MHEVGKKDYYFIRMRGQQNICVTWQGTDYGYPEDDTIVSKHVKCKAIPVKAWTDPEVSRRLRFPDFKTIGT